MEAWEDESVSLEEYLVQARGPRHLPLHIVLPITLLYSVIFVAGVAGNITVTIVIWKNPSLHTPTNYYLFSLAVSDLTFLILGLPNDLSLYWQQYPWMFGVGICKLRALISEMSSYTSVLTIVGFTAERYVAVCKPLATWRGALRQRAKRLIAASWLLALLFASPFAVFTTVNYIDFPPGSGKKVPDSAFCAMLDVNIPKYFPIYEISSFLFFLLPMVIIMILYIRIATTIRRSEREPVSKEAPEMVLRKSRNKQNRKSVIRMLVAVVVTFFICWAPFHTQRLLYLYGRQSPHFFIINEWMYYITGVFYYFSSTINPILYNLMSVKYRTAFKVTFLRFYKKSNSRYSDHRTRPQPSNELPLIGQSSQT